MIQLILTLIYQVAMYYTVYTLLSQAIQSVESLRILGCVTTLNCVKTALDNGKKYPEEQVRTKTLDGYKDIIDDNSSFNSHSVTTENWLTVFSPRVEGWVERLRETVK